MPSAWKKAKLGTISLLLASNLGKRAKRGVGDSPLVVQAGFPTSVADFVVKNRGRLKKTPQWLWHPRSVGGDAGYSTTASLASEIAAASASADTAGPPGSPPGLADSERKQEELRFSAAARVKAGRDATSEEGHHRSPPAASPTALGERSPPATESLANTCRANSPKGEHLQSPTGAEMPRNDVIQGLPRPKVPGSDVPLAFPVPKAGKNEIFEGFPGGKMTKDEVPWSFPCSKAVPREEPRKADGSASGASTRMEPVKNALEVRKIKGLVVPPRVLFLLFVLAMGTKKVALGVSISAFAILFLESMGRRLIPFLKPHVELKKISDTVAGGVSAPDLPRPPDGSNSGQRRRVPIENIPGFCDPDSGSFDSDGKRDSKAPVEVASPAVRTPAPPLQAKDHVEAGSSRGDRGGRPRCRKAKTSLSKLVPKKLRWAKCGKGGTVGGKPDPASDPSNKGVPCHKGEADQPLGEEGGAGAGSSAIDDGNEDDEGGGGAVGFEVPAEVPDVGLKGADFLEGKMDKPTNGGSGRLVLFLVVLSGLAGGRIVATVLTVAGYSLVSSARSLRKSLSGASKASECEMRPLQL